MNRDETQRLCTLGDIPDGGARGFTLERPAGPSLRVLAVRRGDAVHAYLNRCATHGAIFRVEDGVCLAGPCQGDQLTPLPLERRGEELRAPLDPED